MIDYLGGELLANNSWSGSRVTKLPDREQLFPSGISDERINNLGDCNRDPDIIIVLLGDNDWGNGVSLTEEKIYGNQCNLYVFSDAYHLLLGKLKNSYPNAKIYCCTLFSTFMPLNPHFLFPVDWYGNNIESYNEAIKNIAYRNQCEIIDLYIKEIPISTIDGSHPDKAGMRQLAKLMYRRMRPLSELVDCEQDHHFLTPIESNHLDTNVLGSTECMCMKCYKTVDLYPNSSLTDFFSLVQAESGYRYKIYPDSNTAVYTANRFFRGRFPDEQEIIAYAEQLLDFLCFCYDSNNQVSLTVGYRFIFSPNAAMIDENGFWILSSLVEYQWKPFAESISAPETNSGIYNQQTDIFTFGMLLYWMATKVDPYDPTCMKTKIKKINPHISRNFSKLIEKCIESNPKKRYCSFDEIRNKIIK